MRRFGAVSLAILLAAPSVGSTPARATVEGVTVLDGRPVAGVTMALVDVRTGAVLRARSGGKGVFSLRVPPGEYALTTENGAGLVVGRAPSALTVHPARVTTTRVELLAVPGALVQEPTATPKGLQIGHEPVGCVVAGQFPLIEATLEPAASVARARVYFKAGKSPAYYVEMVPGEQPGQFAGKLPRPRVEASPITYYIVVTSTDNAEVKTAEYAADVVEQGTQCSEGVKIAAIGPPGHVTVFSATTGATVAPAGFAAGGLALTAGTLGLVAGGAAAAGITAAVNVFNPAPTPVPTPVPTPEPEPTPPATPFPSPSPSPTPTPEPSPVPTPIPATAGR